MTKKVTVRISNEIGNQLFMYASSYAIASKLERILQLDNETAFSSSKNISKYGLNNFTISSVIADKNNKFLGFYGYLKRKILKKINLFSKKKIFYIEPKDRNKITNFSDEIYNLNLSNNVYLEGYFESEKYFKNIDHIIRQEFKFIDAEKYKKSPFFNVINKKNSVSICLRQNRYTEGKNKNIKSNQDKSENFKLEQINYINKSIDYIKKIIKNPIFYLWSNDLENIDMSLFNSSLIKIIHDQKFITNLDRRSLDLFLITQCNHHIVIPSSFNWWGAWLSEKEDKVICRPNDSFFTNFKVNNLDFWPSNWKVVP